MDFSRRNFLREIRKNFPALGCSPDAGHMFSLFNYPAKCSGSYKLTVCEKKLNLLIKLKRFGFKVEVYFSEPKCCVLGFITHKKRMNESFPLKWQ